MKDKFCPAGKIECEHFATIPLTGGGHLPACRASNPLGQILSSDTFTCWWPSSRQPIAPASGIEHLKKLRIINGIYPVDESPAVEAKVKEVPATYPIECVNKAYARGRADMQRECVEAANGCDRFTGHPGDMIYLADVISEIQSLPVEK